jgi:hypothetical protein
MLAWRPLARILIHLCHLQEERSRGQQAEQHIGAIDGTAVSRGGRVALVGGRGAAGAGGAVARA